MAEFIDHDDAYRRGLCEECHHKIDVRDPYSTGDSWYIITECERLNRYQHCIIEEEPETEE